jgi:hypothetical protein
MKIFSVFRQCIGQEPARPAMNTVPRPDDRTAALPAQTQPTRPPARISPQIWNLLVCGRGSKKHQAPVVDTDSGEGGRASSDAALSDGAGAIRRTDFKRPRFSFESEAGAEDAVSVAGASSREAASDDSGRDLVIPADRYGLPRFFFETGKTGHSGGAAENPPVSIPIDDAAFDTESIHPPTFRHPPLEERKYLTRYELAKLMPWGRDAEKRSGLVGSHIDALKDVATRLDTTLAFRKVNPAAQYWIQHNLPVKDLTVKSKSEKDGPLQGLLVSPGGRRGSTVEALDGKMLGLKLEEMISNNSLEVIENTAEEDADPGHRILTVHDPEKKETYKMRFNVEDSTFSVFKFDGKDFKPVRFKGLHGKPLTADYDAFDFYPRLKNRNFAGFKDIDTGAIERPKPRFADLANIVAKDVLELPEVRQTKGRLGRLSALDEHIIKTCNDEIRKQSGYPHDVLMHGKEKRNTQYPEPCNEVFFIFPDGQTLMSTSWEQTQAVDYAIKQEGFVSTDNRVYNIPAGSKVLFHDQRNPDGSEAIPPASGKRIDWDSRVAAEKLHGDYAMLDKIVFTDPFGLHSKDAGKSIAGPLSASTGSNTRLGAAAGQTLRTFAGNDFRRPSAASLSSIESASSTASMQSIPPWLNSLVSGASAGPSTPTSVRRTSTGSIADAGSSLQSRLLRAIREISEDDQDGFQNDSGKV